MRAFFVAKPVTVLPFYLSIQLCTDNRMNLQGHKGYLYRCAMFTQGE